MLRKFIFLAAIIPLMFTAAKAADNESTPATIQQAFQEQASLNMIGFCPDNVFYFLKKIEVIDKGEIQNFSVLIIYSTAGSLFPQKNRRQDPALDFFGDDREWLFHVIALYKNHVYDFDYDTNEKPTLADYLQKMFLENKNNDFQMDEIKVMTVPAQDYLKLDPYFAGVEIKTWIKENTHPSVTAISLQP
jgi:hypothetical protein